MSSHERPTDQAASKAEAVELTRRFLAVAGGEGECELRQLYDAPGAGAT